MLGFWASTSALLWWLFERNYLDARRSETLTLTDRELIVDRIAPDGEREEHRLEAYWLKVEVERLRTSARLVGDLARQPRSVIGRFLCARARRRTRSPSSSRPPSPHMRSPRYDARRWR